MPSRPLLDELLSGDSPAGFHTADLERVRELLSDLEAAAPERLEALPEPLVEAVLLATVRNKAPALAESLADSKNKPIAKLAKKALYRLKSGGVAVTPPKPQTSLPPREAANDAEAFPCFLSPVSGTGERAVLLHHVHRSRIETLYVVMSDEHGVVQSLLGESTRGKFTKMVKMLRSENRADIEITLEEARQIVGEAAALNLASRNAYPDGLSEALRHFDITVAARPFEAPEPEEGDARLAVEGHTLHEQPEIATWMPSERDLKVLVQKLAAIESSPLQLSSAQRSEQLMQTLRAHAREAFTPEVRKIYSRRLWTMADYFARTARPHPADVARAESRRLAHHTGEPFSRFAEALFEKVLRLMALSPESSGNAAAEEARPKPSSGLILTP